MHESPKIRELKKMILKKKILFSYLVDYYAFWSRVYRYVLNTFAICSIIVGIIAEIIDYQSSIVLILLNTITAALIKIREYLDFDKIKEVGKVQAIKYAQLYNKFEQGIAQTKGTSRLNEFLYWASREMGIIEIGDPDVSSKIKQRFVKVCEKYGIKCDDDDLLLLKSLANEPSNGNEASSIDCENNDGSSVLTPTRYPHRESHVGFMNIRSNCVRSRDNINLDGTDSSIDTALKENEQNKEEFKKMSIIYDNRAALQWALENLGKI